MRRILLAFLLLAFAVSASADDRLAWGGSMMVVGGGTPAAGGASYVFQENFEGTGYDGGTWTETGSVVDEDYATSPAPLVGSQSLLLDSGSTYAYTTSPTFSDLTTAYGYFQIHFLTVNDTATQYTLFALRNGTTDVFKIFNKLNALYIGLPDTVSVGSTAVSAGTTYHVWWDYTAGGGSDAVGNLYIATTATKPGSPTVTKSDGAATLDGNNIRLHSYSTKMDVVIDKIRVDDANIGSDPS